MKQKCIICSHLLNNYTGSPLVLREVIGVFNKLNYPVKLFLGNTVGDGFLSGLEVEYVSSFYGFKENKFLRFIYLFGAQFDLFLKVLLKVKRQDCQLIYANTLYSFGAALAGRLKGIRVIYHVHETSLHPAILKQFLLWVVKRTSSLNIYVSKYHRQQEGVSGVISSTVYNCVDRQLFAVAERHVHRSDDIFTVFMASSLKKYKGCFEFLDLARRLESNPQIKFELVLNATTDEIDDFFEGVSRPGNITIYPSQSDMVPFYTRASVVLNLSHPELWVETFGMTLLEAMSFGVPVIAPEVGGPTELVDDGKNGYLISVHKVEEIAQKIAELSETPLLCERLSVAARQKARSFAPQIFESKISESVGE